MKLEQPLKDAGVDVDRARVLRAAESVLRGAKWQLAAAVERLLREVNADVKLLRGLHGIAESASRDAASALLAQLIQDRKGPTQETASRARTESQNIGDRRSPAPSDSSRASPVSHASRSCFDRPAAPVSAGGASQVRIEGQCAIDRPSRSISSASAVAFATSSVMNERVSQSYEFLWGDITQRDFLNLRVKNAFAKEVERGLEKLKWPDMDTPARTFASEPEMRAIAERASKARDAAASAVRAISHAQ